MKRKQAEKAMVTWLRIVFGRNVNLIGNFISYELLWETAFSLATENSNAEGLKFY
jgi:hypothetical protein